MKFNINHYVRIRLTDYGRSIVKGEKHPWPDLIEDRKDSEGFHRVQMWVAMSTFGPFIGMGAPLCFDNTIEIIPDQSY